MAFFFRSTADFTPFYPAFANTEWDRMVPSADLVEESRFRNQVLGTALFDELKDAYDASIASPFTALSTPLATLLDKVRRPLAQLIIYEAYDSLQGNWSGAGHTVTTTQNVERAPMWMSRRFQANALKHGNAYLDLLIDFLAKNESDYPNWATAPIRAEIRESFIPSMTTADRFLRPIGGAWLLAQLRPAMREVQTGAVLGILGQSNYDTLLALVVANTTPTSDQAKQLDQIRTAILHGALADQVIPLGLTVDHNGVWTWETVSSGSGVSGGEKSGGDARINALVNHHERKRDAALKNLQNLVTPEAPFTGGFPDTNGSMMMM